MLYTQGDHKIYVFASERGIINRCTDSRPIAGLLQANWDIWSLYTWITKHWRTREHFSSPYLMSYLFSWHLTWLETMLWLFELITKCSLSSIVFLFLFFAFRFDFCTKVEEKKIMRRSKKPFGTLFSPPCLSVFDTE